MKAHNRETIGMRRPERRGITTCFGRQARTEHMAGQLPARNSEKHGGHGQARLLSALTIPAIFGRTVR